LILLAIPMSLVGVAVIFWLTHSVFDSSAQIGLVLLFGVAVNNAILLASRYRTEATLILKARLGEDPELSTSLFPPLRRTPGGKDMDMLPREERVPLLMRAVARGSRVRMQSIFLTSGTTIVGMAPLLVHLNEGADKDIWENLALASIGGLTSSMILALLITPVVYTTSIRLTWRMRELRDRIAARWRRRSASPEPGVAES
ncbi:MAG TPA: efflux RND transporter permease subunit, partial [Candidatus Krumholzibacteria bacterium]